MRRSGSVEMSAGGAHVSHATLAEGWLLSTYCPQSRQRLMRDDFAVSTQPSSQPPSNDLRSYHVSSRKIAEKIGYVPKRTIEDAVRDLCRAFKAGKLPNSFDDEQYFNVKTVRSAGLK